MKAFLALVTASAALLVSVMPLPAAEKPIRIGDVESYSALLVGTRGHDGVVRDDDAALSLGREVLELFNDDAGVLLVERSRRLVGEHDGMW